LEYPVSQSEYSRNNDSRYETWKETAQVLKEVLGRFKDTRAELNRLSQLISDNENLVSRHLERLDSDTACFKVMCLVPPGKEYLTSRIGLSILGKNPEKNYSTLKPVRPTRLDVNCLGTLRVCSADRQIQRWQSTRAKSVFEYLLNKKGTPVTREVLVETLWPEHNIRAAGNNLKTAVYALRQTLNQVLGKDDSYASILFSQGSYLINPEIELSLDTEEFERCWMDGRRLEKENKAEQAVREYEKAEALYQGDYLEDEPYEEWTLLRREAIKDNYLFVLGKLADYAMAFSDFERCIFYCQKILARDPSREDTYRRIMRCYSRLGQRNQAVRWYETCCQALRSELDAGPDRETRDLHNSLIKGDSI